MATKTEIRFRLKPRWFIDSQTGERNIDDDNSLITMRITYGAMRLEYSTGYHIKATYWDTNAGYAIGGSFGKSSDEINGGLVRFKKSAIETIKLFQEKEVMPTQMEFKDTFKRINEGIQISTNPNIEKKTSTRKRAVENGDNNKSNSDNTCSTESFNNLSREQKTKEITKTFTFWDIYHEYEACIEQMPLGTAKVVGFPVEQDAVGGIVEMIIAATDALIARFQQVFMLIDHAETKHAIHCDDELG